MNDSKLLAQAFRCYEKLWAINGMATLGHELRALDVMQNSGLWLT